MDINFTIDNEILIENQGDTEYKRLFPLEFLCNYLTDKQEELMSRELDTAFRVHSLHRDAKEILEQMKQFNKRQISEEAVDIVLAQEEFCKKIGALENELTLKSTAFEDMSNMLEQTEPLITELVYKDALTNAYNRYFLEGKMESFMQDASEGKPFSVAFIDIDDFKFFNTEYGHDFGDIVLKRINYIASGIIAKEPNTYFVRIGGDEFLILNSGMNYQSFYDKLDLFRTRVADERLKADDEHVQLTLSIGVASMMKDKSTAAAELVKLADKRLYKAKRLGKNIMIDE